MSLADYGYSARTERWRVIRPVELGGLGLLVMLVCWLVFPRQLATTLRAARMDAVTLSYAESWLRARPEDYELRLLVARDLIELGLTEEAAAQLDYVASHTRRREWLDQRAWLAARLPFVAYMAVAPSERAGHPLGEEATRAFEAVDPGTLDAPSLRDYAAMAEALARPAAAVRAFHLIADRSDDRAVWYREAARIWLAQGRYGASAEERLRAMDAEPDADRRREDFLQALATLQAGSLFDQAMAVARRRAPAYRDQPEVLYRLMNLARASGDARQARYFAALLLELAVPEEGP